QSRLDSERRIQSFLRGVADACATHAPSSSDGFVVRRLGTVDWTRQRGFAQVAAILAEARRESLPGVIFCANDWMAIGVRDAFALLEQRLRKPLASPPQICSYDGIPYVRDLLGEDDKFLFGTVCQDFSALARAAVQSLDGRNTARMPRRTS